MDTHNLGTIIIGKIRNRERRNRTSRQGQYEKVQFGHYRDTGLYNMKTGTDKRRLAMVGDGEVGR